MRIHHFLPLTNNIGDHFVQRGIERMVRRIRPEAAFEHFDINGEGRERSEFGLTINAVERANNEADLIIVGGSNLYEGNYRRDWGIHLETGALEKLRVPLLLLGVGSGSNFNSPLHRPSKRAEREIRLVNDYAKLSGVRDVITLEWMHQMGVTKAKLTGDPATFIFNQPYQKLRDRYILIAVPPRRFWSSKSQFWKVRVHGRAMFRALKSLAENLLANGEHVVVVCNDPIDLPLAKSLFAGVLPVACPQTPEEYFLLLSASRAVFSGRLHTAVVAFSLGLPFVLLDVDQRTAGFIKTYQLERWALRPSRDGIEKDMQGLAATLLHGEEAESWKVFIERREKIYAECMTMLEEGLS